MKFALVFILLFLISFSIFAQDTIIFINGDEVTAQILEVGESIKYKKYTNLDGPVYITQLHEVFKIIYNNGTQDVFNVEREQIIDEKPVFFVEKRIEYYDDGIDEGKLYFGHNGFNKQYFEGYDLITKETFLDKLSSNQDAIAKYKSGQSLITGGNLVAVLGTAVIIISSANFVRNSKNSVNNIRINTYSPKLGGGGIIGGGILMLAGVAIAYSGVSKKHTALDVYNISVSEKIGFGVGENGVGLVVRF